MRAIFSLRSTSKTEKAVLCALALATATAAGELSPETKFALESYRSTVSRFKTFSGRFTSETIGRNTKPLEKGAKYIVSRDNEWRDDFENRRRTIDVVSALHDGTKLRERQCFDGKESWFAIWPDGSRPTRAVRRRNSIPQLADLDTPAWAIGLIPPPFELEASLRQTAALEDLGESRIDGEACRGVSVNSGVGDLRFRATIWFSPSAEFLPRSIEISLKRGSQYTCHVEEFKRLSTGQSDAPFPWRFRVHRAGWQNQDMYELKSLVINKNIPIADSQVDARLLPAGVEVIDEVENRAYVTGGAATKHRDAQTDSKAEATAPSGQTVAKQPTSLATILSWVLAALGAVTLVAGIALKLRPR